jgi:hypothetical protein
MMLTVQQLVENARARHPAFTKLAWPDGALLLFLNTYQRTKLLELADSIEPLVGQAKQIASVIAGALVGSDGGVPFYITTSGDGWPVQNLTAAYPMSISRSRRSHWIRSAHFGRQPGFPAADRIHPADQHHRRVALRCADAGRDDAGVAASSCTTAVLSAFISGNRIVPIRLGAAPYSDRWIDVTSVTMSYIAMQTLDALTDVLTLPIQLAGSARSGAGGTVRDRS